MADSPVNGTSLTISELMSGSCAACRVSWAPTGGTRNARLPPWRGVFLASSWSFSEPGGMWASLIPRVRHDSEAVDVDRRQVVR